MLSKMSALADMSHKCDKKSSRTFQRNFSEEKFLSEGPPTRVPLFACRFAARKFTPPAFYGRKSGRRPDTPQAFEKA